MQDQMNQPNTNQPVELQTLAMKPMSLTTSKGATFVFPRPWLEFWKRWIEFQQAVSVIQERVMQPEVTDVDAMQEALAMLELVKDFLDYWLNGQARAQIPALPDPYPKALIDTSFDLPDVPGVMRIAATYSMEVMQAQSPLSGNRAARRKHKRNRQGPKKPPTGAG